MQAASLWQTRASLTAVSDIGDGPTIMRRAGERVTRSDFVRKAVIALFGSLAGEYSSPYQNVPPESKKEIGVARAVNAIADWGREGKWSTTVTRGEALDILFRLAQMEPQAGTSNGFSDVRGARPAKLVAQAVSWKLLEPLTPKNFGWSRAVTAQELSLLLERFAAKVHAPLKAPAIDKGALERPTPTEKKTSSRKTDTAPKKGTITIETGMVDGPGRVNKTALPRSDLLETVWGLVQEKFLYEDRINQEEIAYSIAETILQKLNDPYSVFLRPVSNERFQEQIQGGNTFSGIGAQVQIHPEGGVEVITPLQGSPAMKAGVKAGDRIIAVDDTDVEKMNLNDAVSLIRGPEGSTVRLTIMRKDAGGKIVIPVVRGTIVLKDLVVTTQDGVGIIRINSFSREAMTEFNQAMKDVMEKAPVGIIVDLRNNPGGLLDAAVLVSSHFLKEGTTVVTVERRKLKEEYKTVGGARPVPMDLPVVVLVNKGSASASEIVAGALKDHQRAEIMGQTTFGKGTVQEAIEFTPDHGKAAAAVKITVAKWLTPSGQEINGKGVEPTIALPESVQGERDEELLEAIKIIKSKAR